MPATAEKQALHPDASTHAMPATTEKKARHPDANTHAATAEKQARHPHASTRPDLALVLATVPADVWAAVWCDSSTLVLRSASKALCALVDTMLLPTAANMSSVFCL
jgi:hypothetical protein